MHTQYREWARQKSKNLNSRLIWFLFVLMLTGTVTISFEKSGNNIRFEIHREQKLPELPLLQLFN